MKSATSFTNHFDCNISCGVGAYPHSGVAPQRAFFAISALLFAVSAALTIVWCNSMSAMGEMRMPGGWTMSMAWTRMPGQTWIEATASFLAMWVVMMAAMMLPSLAPMLGRYRQAVGGTGASRLAFLTVLAGLGYFFVWTLFGLAVFPLGVVLATAEMEHPEAGSRRSGRGWRGHPHRRRSSAHVMEGTSPCVLPGNAGACRTLPADAGTAWRQGARFGFHCSLSCANLTAILLVVGVMDLRAMALVTAAITAERLAPAGKSVARAIGVVAIGAGLLLIAQSAGL